MSHRLVAACLAMTAALVVTSCGSDGQQAQPPSGSTTPPSISVPSPSSPSSAAASVSPTSAQPLGPITPSGRPTLTVPPSPPASIGAVCLEPADAARKVTFRASSGATLTGALLGRGDAGVVLVHQSDGDLCQWLPYARDLAKTGYLVLTMDLEGRGSAGFVQYDGNQPVPYGLDVAAAARYLRTHGAAKVVLVGASMGGTAVLAGAAIARPAVNGVVSVSAPAEYAGIDARTAATRLTVPVLYVAATEDNDYEAMARMLYAATRSPRSLSIVPGSAHGVALVDDPGDPRVRRDVDSFIAAHAR
jgi:pimeloyl-ACP methyl ester carboxylesterase